MGPRHSVRFRQALESAPYVPLPMACVCNRVLTRSNGVGMALATNPAPQPAMRDTCKSNSVLLPLDDKTCFKNSFVLTMIIPYGTFVANVTGKLRYSPPYPSV